MQRIQLGRTGLMVSSVGFGGIPITRLAEDAGAELVREAARAGINFFDTAYVYPGSEQRIGRGIRGADRDELVIATKDPSTDGPMFARHVEECLARLGLDRVDIIQHHSVSDREGWKAIRAPGGAYEAAQRLRDAGKVGHLGVTCHNVELATEIAESGLFETLQVPFNFLADEAAPLVDLCRRKGLGFIAMKPFAGGYIEDGELAVRFLQQYPSAVAIPGIETPEELRQVIDLYEHPRRPTEAELSRMQALRQELGKVFCRACGYCQPCPKEIAIPMVLRARSFARRMQAELTKRVLDRHMAGAEDCQECGECVKRCPYHLEIPAMLRQSRAWYDEWLKTLPR